MIYKKQGKELAVNIALDGTEIFSFPTNHLSVHRGESPIYLIQQYPFLKHVIQHFFTLWQSLRMKSCPLPSESGYYFESRQNDQ